MFSIKICVWRRDSIEDAQNVNGISVYMNFLLNSVFVEKANEKNPCGSKIGSHFTENLDFSNRSKNLSSILFLLSKMPKTIAKLPKLAEWS